MGCLRSFPVFPSSASAAARKRRGILSPPIPSFPYHSHWAPRSSFPLSPREDGRKRFAVEKKKGWRGRGMATAKE